MPYVQSRIHSDYDSADSIADSDLEDGELRKMLASPLFLHGRGEKYGSSRKPTASGKPEAKIVQKRGASAQRTQAEHSRRESLKSNSSHEPRASGKLDALFSSRTDEPGNQFESSMFKFADPSNLGRSLLEVTKDHLSELMKQEHQVGSLNSCINEHQQQAYDQVFELQDAHHGFLESRREQARLQEELSMKEKRNIHELGEVKRARELRFDEVSVQKFRESHETIQRLTSQLQSMQEQMNSMRDSGEFQEVGSNHSGRLSHVPSQPEVIPSSSSMFSRDKRLPFDFWNAHGLQENVFGNHFSTFGSPGNPSQGIHYDVAHETRRETESVPRAIGKGTSFARDDEQNKGTIPMPSQYWWKFRRPPRLDRTDSKCRSCTSSNSLLHNHFLLVDKIQKPSDYLF